MRKMRKQLSGTIALAFTLCLAGMLMAGAAFAQQCVDNGNGTVTDVTRGLMWQAETGGPMTWYRAAVPHISYTQGLGGHTDWRMPTKQELQWLYGSAQCRSLIKVISYGYWSATTEPPELAWLVAPSGATGLEPKNFDDYYVRAVRDVQ